MRWDLEFWLPILRFVDFTLNDLGLLMLAVSPMENRSLSLALLPLKSESVDWEQ